MPESTKAIELRINDVTGRAVRHISIPPSETGNPLSATWDATDSAGKKLPAGVYFVQFSGDRAIHTAKLVLLR